MLTSIRQQGANYWQVLKWLLSSYYQSEKLTFWMIQLLMGLSVVTGLAWVLGIVAGLNYLNGSDAFFSYDFKIISLFFSQPLWFWVVTLSGCGLLSAYIKYISFKVGVNSVIRYQKGLLEDGLAVLINNELSWALVLQDSPKMHMNRVLKIGVQMAGLVVRRLARMLVPSVTFILAVFALYRLNLTLLLLMVPLVFLYLIVLYFINRKAARNQIKLAGLTKSVQPKFGTLIDRALTETGLSKADLSNQINESDYEAFSSFRYKRRLAEIHVVWLNSFFLVLGSALIIFFEGLGADQNGVDWGQLILFIIALRYAGTALQEIASSTVAFSRFLPETELLYQLLTAERIKPEKAAGIIFALNLSGVVEDVFKKTISQQIVINDWIQLDMVDVLSLQLGDQDFNNACVISTNPAQFKQVVKKNKNHIDRIILLDAKGVFKTYQAVEFIDSFILNDVIVNDSKLSQLWDEQDEF